MRSKLVISLGAVLLLASCVVASVQVVGGGDKQAGRVVGVTYAEGSDIAPNQTATDWVTHADYVVAVTAMRDREIQPADSEIKRGEGLIGRTVDLRVDDVVWSRSDASHPAPKSISWQSDGWQFKNGSTDNRIKVAALGQPRVETGHSYILAVFWQPARCTGTADATPARWLGLGADSVVPFDDGVIGRGESEGRTRTEAQVQKQLVTTGGESDPNYSLEDALTGESATDLVSALNTVKPALEQRNTAGASGENC